jgi:tetratricopeptide (TPR) repeat protein
VFLTEFIFLMRTILGLSLLPIGYIDLELENFKDAIAMFGESLKIQKVRLEPDSRLILNTMDNVAYCRCKLREFEKASIIYNDLVTIQSSSANKQSQKDWVQSLKKQIYCQIKLYQYDEAFDNLRILEDYLETKGGKMRNALRRTHKLMVQVNYQMFKFPTLSDYAGWVSCSQFCGETKENAIDAEAWSPKKPVNESKMSGQRMTYA